MEKYTVNTNIFDNNGSVNLDLSIGEDFATNLNQSSLYNAEYLEKVKDDSVNKIVDYEKYMFIPSYYTLPFYSTNSYYCVNDDGLAQLNKTKKILSKEINEPTFNLDEYAHNIEQINFNIHLRKRTDFETWDVKEGAYWNIWDGISPKPTEQNSILGHGDLLGNLGFTDDDVLYQKNALKKSFLRISIYDSPLRQSQKLLYYSTLFFDTNVLYQKYINLSQGRKIGNLVYYKPPVISQSNIKTLDKLLTAQFTCTTKNDMSASSDGFYLYLFKSLTDGGKSTPLYMKVEFNNAKYGKTVPLICPRYTSTVTNSGVTHYQNEAIRFESDDFPLDYQAPSVGYNENSYIDTKKLYRDLYIPIIVRYNTRKQQFEWSILSDNQNNNIENPNADNYIVNIDLFEARINGYKQAVKPKPANYITFKSNIENSSVGLTNRSNNQTTLQYSTDKEEWIDLIPGNSVSLNTNDELYVRGILEGNNTSVDYTMFSIIGGVSVSGNLNNLWNYENLEQQIYQYCGYGLFRGCTGLTDASGLTLPATTLANYCYQSMFQGCASLTTAPDLPATVLADFCYYAMFTDCTLLTASPILSATTLANYCYGYMFANCKNLTAAPELPATILTNNCYNHMFSNCTKLATIYELSAITLAKSCCSCMFENCTTLITVPNNMLSATTLAEDCYSYMFYGCTSLTSAPELPATSLADGCYSYMFSDCTSLTSAPELPATALTNNCYRYMFYRCTKLKYIKCLAINNITQSNMTNWTGSVASNGLFIKNINTPESSWSKGNSGIPTNWVAMSNEMEFIELDLLFDGHLWADRNIGATCENTKESWYGNYYPWAEVTPRPIGSTTYNYRYIDNWKLKKYCTMSEYGYDGFVDNKTVLETTDDIANVLDNTIKIPSVTNCENMLNNILTVKTYVTDYAGVTGLNGLLVKVNDGTNKIFIPTNGSFHGSNSEPVDTGEYGYLQTSEIPSNGPTNEYFLHVSVTDRIASVSNNHAYGRYAAFGVRPIKQRE